MNAVLKAYTLSQCMETMAEYVAQSKRMFGKRVSAIHEEDGNYQVTLQRVAE